jgi:hypothetical protein
VGGRDRGLGEDGCCHGPSTPWPTFARRERKRKSAIPVGMTNSGAPPLLCEGGCWVVLFLLWGVSPGRMPKAKEARTYVINVKRTEKSISSGAKAHFFLAFDVGAKAPTPKPHL